MLNNVFKLLHKTEWCKLLIPCIHNIDYTQTIFLVLDYM